MASNGLIQKSALASLTMTDMIGDPVLKRRYPASFFLHVPHLADTCRRGRADGLELDQLLERGGTCPAPRSTFSVRVAGVWML